MNFIMKMDIFLSMIKTLNKDNVKDSIENKILVFFYDDNSICKKVRSIIESFSLKYNVGQVNVKEDSYLRSKYKIEITPTILIFDHSRVMTEIVGGFSMLNLVENWKI